MVGTYILIVFGLFCGIGSTASVRYTPDWNSLDSRPIPSWYDEAKFGIFIHWGVFSAVGFGNHKDPASFWYDWSMGDNETLEYLKRNFPPDITYADFGRTFRAEFFDPYQWADIFKASGAKYIVLTSKHDEGFANWPSTRSPNWNSVDVGPKRNLVGELLSAIRSSTFLKFGLYHSLLESQHPLYLYDMSTGWKTQRFVRSKTLPERYEIINTYRPDILWSDGDWDSPDTYWNSTNFLAWLFNESPVKDYIVINDRWGDGAWGHHGGFYTYQDKYNPKVLQNHKWENCLTLDRYTWGHRRNMQAPDILTMDELTEIFAETISCGGNMLLNVGPTGDGRIDPMFEERLRQMGDWLKVNGEAVYGSKPWIYQNDTLTSGVWYTSKASLSGTDVFAIVLDWPKTQTLSLTSAIPTPETTVNLLGYDPNILWQELVGGGINIILPVLSTNQMPGKWAWVFKLSNLKQSKH